MSPVTQSAGGGGGGDGVGAPGASGLELAVAAEIERLRQDLYALNELYEDLRVKYNAHTHIENTAPAYTQNATTAAPPAGSQATVGLVTG